jgi:DNA integrity scanning protein DisA with diadenylate cyclase activity
MAGLFLLLISLYRKMLESFIPAIIAIVTGTAVLFNKVNHRVSMLDQKVDRLELKVVESFTTKADFSSAMERMESHMIRIEDKLDKLVDKKCTT